MRSRTWFLLIGLGSIGVSAVLLCHAVVSAEDATIPTRAARGSAKRTDASESTADEAKLERKLDNILANQQQVLANQQTILQKLDAMMEELRVIKVRATLRSG